MKIRMSDKRLRVSGVNIEFADYGDMYDVHELKLRVHCKSPCRLESLIPLTKPEMEKLGEALILIQQRLNTELEVPKDILDD